MRGSLDTTRLSGAGIFFAGAVVLALLAGMTVYALLNSAVETSAVYVLTRDIPPGETIQASDLIVKQIPVNGVPEKAIKDSKTAIGARSRFGLAAGDIIRETHLVTQGSDLANQVATMGEQFRAIMLPGELVPGVDRLVPGDRLELTGILPFQDKAGSSSVAISMGRATVLDIPKGKNETDRTVVLAAVKAEEVARVGLTMRAGTLTVSLVGHGVDPALSAPLRLDTVINSALGTAPRQ